MSNDDSEYYDYVNFEDLDANEKRFWISIMNFASEYSLYLDHASLVIATFGLFGNIFHLAVLTRKSMRNSSVTVFLIGIAFCDLFRMTSTVVSLSKMCYEEFLTLYSPENCIPPKSYLEMSIFLALCSLEMLSSDLSVWFAVFMTIFRALVMRYPFHQRINSLVKSKAGLCAVIPIFVLISPFTLFFHYHITIRKNSIWHPSPDCLDFPPNYSQIEYYYLATELSGKLGNALIENMLHIEGILFKFIPSIALLVATLILVSELKKWKKIKVTIKSKNDKERTTKLVFFVTLSFLIAIIPQGMSYIIMLKTLEGSIFRVIVNYLSVTYSFLSVINGAIHFLIVYFMASEYRTAAKCLFWKKTNSVPIINVTSSGNMNSITNKKC